MQRLCATCAYRTYARQQSKSEPLFVEQKTRNRFQIRVTPEQLGAVGGGLDMMRVVLGEQVNIRMEALLDVVDYGSVPPAERNAPIRQVVMRLRLFHLDTGNPVLPRICSFCCLKHSLRNSL